MKNTVGKRMFVVSNRFKRYLDSQYQKIGLSLSQGRLLNFVSSKSKDGIVYQKDVENDFGIRRSSVTTLVDGLVKGGYLRRIEGEQDRRVKKLEVTTSGIQKMFEIEQIVQEFDYYIDSNLSKREKNFYNQIMEKLDSLIQEKELENVKVA